MRRLAVFFPALFALLFLAAPGQAQTKLRYQYKAGDKKAYVLEQKTTSKTNVKGMDIASKVSMSIDMSYEVKKVDDGGNAHMELRFGRTRMELDSIGGIIEVDSEDKKEAPDKVGKVLQSLVKTMSTASLTFTMDQLGKVSDVKIPDEVLKSFRELEGAGGAGGFDENTFTTMAEASLVLPEKEIGKGKSWNHVHKHNLPIGKLTSDSLYTYEGQEEKNGKKVEVIAMAPKIQIEPADKEELKITLKEANARGKGYFDNKAGVLIQQDMEVTMEMDIEVGGMTLIQHVVQNTTVRLKN